MIAKLSASSIKDSLVRLVFDEEGGELVENVLVVGLLTVACLVGMKALGIKIALRWSDINDLL
ncbi:MAG TPA: hypothetical protein VG326_03000 [Tepidisphaeraceae bacterium]|nr:hypothetical protein [Tepidisphaeraceae bacterium]